VLELSRDQKLCQQLGVNGRRYVMAHFDRITLARRLASVVAMVCPSVANTESTISTGTTQAEPQPTQLKKAA